MIVSSIYNALYAFAGKKEYISPEDILGKGKEQEEQSEEEMEIALRAWAGLQGGSENG